MQELTNMFFKFVYKCFSTPDGHHHGGAYASLCLNDYIVFIPLATSCVFPFALFCLLSLLFRRITDGWCLHIRTGVSSLIVVVVKAPFSTVPQGHVLLPLLCAPSPHQAHNPLRFKTFYKHNA